MANAFDDAVVHGELRPGTKVEVLSRFDSSWARGFEVAETRSGRYRLRRVSDGSLLPAEFTTDEVRQERHRRTSLW